MILIQERDNAGAYEHQNGKRLTLAMNQFADYTRCQECGCGKVFGGSGALDCIRHSRRCD
jgi:hypothetical protein